MAVGNKLWGPMGNGCISSGRKSSNCLCSCRIWKEYCSLWQLSIRREWILQYSSRVLVGDWSKHPESGGCPNIKDKAQKGLYQRGTSGSRGRGRVLEEKITTAIFQRSLTETWEQMAQHGLGHCICSVLKFRSPVTKLMRRRFRTEDGLQNYPLFIQGSKHTLMLKHKHEQNTRESTCLHFVANNCFLLYLLISSLETMEVQLRWSDVRNSSLYLMLNFSLQFNKKSIIKGYWLPLVP